MHDLQGPLVVENVTDANGEEDEEAVNITATRYQFGQFIQNGNHYTTQLIVPELQTDDEGQTVYLNVQNRIGSSNYTFTFENLDSGLSPGAIAGIVIGSVAGVALIAGLAAFFLLKKKGKMNKKSKSNTDPVPTPRAQQRSPD